jgi:hypothetical protein
MVNIAQETANRAVDVKYSTIELQLNVYQSQLNAILPLLSKEEKTTAIAQQAMLDDQRQKIADQKEAEKNVQSIMLAAAQAGVPNDILNKISATTTFNEALQLAAPFLKTNVEREIDAFTDAEGNRIVTFYNEKTGATRQINLGKTKVDKQTAIIEKDGRQVLVDMDTGTVLQDMGAASVNTQITTVNNRQVLINTDTGVIIRDLGSSQNPIQTSIIDKDGRQVLINADTGAVIQDLGASQTPVQQQQAQLNLEQQQLQNQILQQQATQPVEPTYEEKLQLQQQYSQPTTEEQAADYGAEVADLKNNMAVKGYSYITSPAGLAGLKETDITRLRDSKGKEYIFKNPVKTTSTPTPTFDYFKQIETNIKGAVGSDGFISPDDYAIAKSDWIKAGGTPADFDKKYANRRNPNNPYYQVTGGSSTDITNPFK